MDMDMNQEEDFALDWIDEHADLLDRHDYEGDDAFRLVIDAMVDPKVPSDRILWYIYDFLKEDMGKGDLIKKGYAKPINKENYKGTFSAKFRKKHGDPPPNTLLDLLDALKEDKIVAFKESSPQMWATAAITLFKATEATPLQCLFVVFQEFDYFHRNSMRNIKTFVNIFNTWLESSGYTPLLES